MLQLGNPAINYHPVHATETWDKLYPDGPLGANKDLTFPTQVSGHSGLKGG